MRERYRRAMDALYYICVTIGGVGIAIMALAIAWGVYSRYVLEQGSFWPEPISIFLAIQVTFYGAAACYRANAHISLSVFANMLPALPRWLVEWFGHLAMAVIAGLMIYYGIVLVRTTYFQVYPEFQYIRVGLVYTAIPISGLITLLFVIERAFLGWPAVASDSGPEVVHDKETR